MSHLALCANAPRASRILTVAFLFPESGDNDWFNRVVARVSRHPCCHVELVFEDDMSFSIFSNSKLFFKKRTFSNPEYRLVSLSVSSLEYATAYSFCAAAMSHEIDFNELGIYAAYFQPCPMLYRQSSIETGYTFCSKVVAEALQAARVQEAEELVPCMTTPSVLYEALKGSGRRVHHSVRFKMDQLRQVGAVVG